MSNVSAGNVSAAIERLWNIDFIKIFILQLVYNICMQMIGSTLPYYVMVLGGSSSEAGVMVGIMTVVALASRPFVGFTLDTKGRRPVMLLLSLIHI